MDMGGRMGTITVIPMDRAPLNSKSLYRLMAWLSPSFPVGAFAYSHGIEWAVEDVKIADADSLSNWLSGLLRIGGGWSDAVLFRNAWLAATEGDWDMFSKIGELAIALCPTKERRLETVQQGNAFMLATRASWPWPGSDAENLQDEMAYPVAVAVAAAGHKVALEPALHAFVHAFAANLISAGVRLIPLGQTDGQRVLARLEPIVAEAVERALISDISQVGGAAFFSDIASMKHETQYTRLFRS